jgi:replicative DNA helicase
MNSEKIILSAIIYIPESREDCFSILTDKQFTITENRNIFKVLLECKKRDMINEHYVKSLLVEMDGESGIEMLSDIRDQIDKASHWKDHLRNINTIWAQSEIIKVNDIVKKSIVKDPTITIELIKNHLDKISNLIWTNTSNRTMNSMSEGFEQSIFSDNDLFKVFKTGVEDLDYIWNGGIAPKTQIVIAAGPSIGKSSFVRFLVRKLIENNPQIAAKYYALETDEKTFLFQNLCALTDIEQQRFSKKDFSPEEVEKIKSAFQQIKNYNLTVTFDPHNTREIILDAQKFAKNTHDNGLQPLIIIDNLGDVSFLNSKTTELETISNEMNNIKNKYNSINILLHHFTKDLTDKKNFPYVPTVAKMRDTGKLDDNADKTILMYRPDHYSDVIEKHPEWAGKTYFIHAKNRNCRIGNIFLYSKMSTYSYYDMNPDNEVEREVTNEN